LRVVSFCSMMVAREASSSTSCHLASVVMSYNSHSQGCALCACKLTAAGRRRGARSRPPPSHACWCFTVMLLHFKQRPGQFTCVLGVCCSLLTSCDDRLVDRICDSRMGCN
jgi:hypothetical protein